MPRTKVPKSSKRNREASAREEKQRDFESSLDSFLTAMDTAGNDSIAAVNSELKLLLQRTSSVLLKMKWGDVMDMGLLKFNDWSASTAVEAGADLSAFTSGSASFLPVPRPRKTNVTDEEGYFTEDSTNCAPVSRISNLSALRSSHQYNQLQQQQSQRGRTPGPLNSARARKTRRSKSACSDLPSMPMSTLQPKLSSHHHNVASTKSANAADFRHSRNQMRTPMAPRSKALSADRAAAVVKAADKSKGLTSPLAAILRWPKPGEVVLSKCGSPVVSQVMPDKFANVNIPVKNGVLSLRPKKLDDIKPDIIESIDPETLSQIKTLHENLDLIMVMANKAANLGGGNGNDRK